ncbi:MAG: type II secretion system F family protein [Bryobacteraceae bacterium]
MWPVLTAAMLGLAAMAVAYKLLRGTPTSSAQMLRRLNLDQFGAPVAPEGDEAADVSKETRLSKIPWMNRWLATIDLTAHLRMILYQADLNWSVGTWLIATLVGWIGFSCLLYLRFWALAPTLALSLLFLPLPTLYVFRCRRKRFAEIEEQLPEALYLLVSALRVGHSLMTAIGYLGKETREPLKGEFQKCFEEQNFGIDLRTALTSLATRVPIQDIRFFVAAVLIQKESGGNMAEVLDNLSRTIRDRFRLKKQARVFTAQGRATGWILSLLPVALGLAMYLVRPEGISILWTTAIGKKLLYTAGVMNILGGLIIRKVVKIRV